ncbi:MAG TPA: fluoride efflux transporter CrcB [Rectinemataceae bacterium]|nr:fluoride efflux transporter CrcB [Rectinemataceae bacterium]
MIDIALVLAGGGVGSLARYLVSLSAGRLFGDSFAWGTMIVNLLGCLLIGFVVGLLDRSVLPRAMRLLLVTGFLGGFTTFSSFALESVRMFMAGSPGKGALNLGINVVAGFALTIAGLFAASRL